MLDDIMKYESDMIILFFKYNIILDSLFKDKFADETFDLYFEMVVKKIYPTVVTYNVLIDAFYKRKMLKISQECVSFNVERLCET